MDDGLGAVLSLVPAAEERTRPIAFAGKPLSQDCSLFLPVHVSITVVIALKCLWAGFQLYFMLSALGLYLNT